MTAPDDHSPPAGSALPSLRAPCRLTISGAPEGHDAYILGRFTTTGEAPAILHVCRDDGRMARLASALAFFNPELEILTFVARGHSNQAIADELVLTKRAVEKHINAIFLKLGLTDAADVARRVKAALIYLSEHQVD